MDSSSVWWQRHPERLELEKTALTKAGYTWQVDEDLDHGILKIEVRVSLGGRTFDLVATFPDLYPYFAPQVVAPNDQLDRHQSPDGVLCLLGRGTVHWAAEMTLAELIQKQLPLVLEAVEKQGSVESAQLESRQGEPYSYYYRYLHGACLLIDSSWKFSGEGGKLRLGYEAPLVVIEQEGEPVVLLRGAVLQVMDDNGAELERAPEEWWARYKNHLTDMPWKRLPRHISATDPEGFLAALPAELAAPPIGAFKAVSTADKAKLKLHVAAILFPEELQWQEQGDGWAFVVNQHRGRKYLARAYRYGREDLFQRTPELQGLEAKRVLVVGAGGLGAPAVLELARAGLGEIRLIEHDVADPATSVRWPFGLEVADSDKGRVLGHFLERHYPYTRFTAERAYLGLARGAGEDQYTFLMRMLKDVDLVLDMTAEFGVHHILADLAARLDTPFVYANATQGAWGGLIARVRPSEGKGCWRCLQHRLYGPAADIPDAPSDPKGGIQARGCADPTFTGAGFDMATMSVAAVRLVAATLGRGEVGGYPDLPWDIQVIQLREDDGSPSWFSRTYAMEKHVNCCGAG